MSNEPDRCRVLGVDDNATNLAILQEALEEEFDFAGVESGDAALAFLEEHEVDVVLLDIMMPGLDGYEVCRRIRADERHVHTKVVLVSAKAMTSERLEGYAAGADDYVTKPFHPEELCAKVRVFHRLGVVEALEEAKREAMGHLFFALREPLNGLVPVLDILESPLAQSDGERAELVTIARRSAAAIQRHVERTERWTQLRDGSTQLSIDVVPWERIELRVGELVEAVSGPGRVRFAGSIGPGVVHADEQAFGEAITALVDGVMRHADPNVEVVVTARVAEGSGLVVDVECSSVDGNLSEKSFTMLAPVMRGGGLVSGGLDLALGRALVRAHGGHVELDAGDGRARISAWIPETVVEHAG